MVRTSSGAPASGAVVVVTNQVHAKTSALAATATAVIHSNFPRALIASTLDQPNIAQFDKDKNYGDFAIVRGDTLENVIIEA